MYPPSTWPPIQSSPVYVWGTWPRLSHRATHRAPLLDAQRKAAEAEAGDRRDGEHGLAQRERQGRCRRGRAAPQAAPGVGARERQCALRPRGIGRCVRRCCGGAGCCGEAGPSRRSSPSALPALRGTGWAARRARGVWTGAVWAGAGRAEGEGRRRPWGSLAEGRGARGGESGGGAHRRRVRRAAPGRPDALALRGLGGPRAVRAAAAGGRGRPKGPGYRAAQPTPTPLATRLLLRGGRHGGGREGARGGARLTRVSSARRTRAARRPWNLLK